MFFSIKPVSILLLTTSLVAIIARKIKLPYTVGLVLTGILLNLFSLPNMPQMHLTKELIFSLLLPPLIFEAAIQIPWPALRKDLPVILTFAILGTLISLGVIAGGLYYFIGWDWLVALLVGTILSATDPVSVIATFNESGIQGRLKLLVETESLLNDGVVVVIYTVILNLLQGEQVSGFGVLSSFLYMAVGGLAFGLIVAFSILWIAGRANDHLVEITLTTVAAYGAFILAEHFHTSGILATLACGLLIGNLGASGIMTEKGKDALLSFWEYIAFAANSVIFILMGLNLPPRIFDLSNLLLFVTVIVLLLLGRAISVYCCSSLFFKSHLKVSLMHQHILFWGGLRGALGLALILGVPDAFPHRDIIIACVFAAVTFSVIIQGVTMTPLLKKLGELPA